MGHRRFSEITGVIEPERRARIDAIKDAALADANAEHHAPSPRGRSAGAAAYACDGEAGRP